MLLHAAVTDTQPARIASTTVTRSYLKVTFYSDSDRELLNKFIIVTHVIEAAAEKTVFVTVRSGMLVDLFWMTVLLLPALKSSQEQKSTKHPPTMHVMEFGLNPIVLFLSY